MKKILLSLFIIIAITSFATAQYTLIPDPNFEARLISLGIDTDGKNGQVLTSSISGITTLDISNSNITNLTGIEGFTSLLELYCDFNKLSSLNVTKNINLTSLWCISNQLLNIEISKNTALTTLNCSYNQLTSLDVSKNIALTNLKCNDNKLTSLDVTKIDGLNNLNCSNNPDLKIICVKYFMIAYAYYIKDATATWSEMCGNTLIPDANFETALINLGIDKDGLNGQVLNSSISSVSSLNISYSNIRDLTGIKNFTSLTNLVCVGNQITNIDFSNNTALTSINCDSNQLFSLIVKKNTALTTLKCNYNIIIDLDVSENINLTTLWASTNQLSNLVTNKNLALTSLKCDNNQLTTLDVTKNTALTTLWCSSNRLTNLDVSKNTRLTTLFCSYNKLTSLDLSKNSVLTYLNCNANQLNEIDINNNLALKTLNCSSNHLISLDIINNTTLDSLNCSTNFIKAICVKNISDINFKFLKDTIALWSETCYTLIPDANFEAALIRLGIDKDGLNGKVFKNNINKLNGLEILGCGITNLTGIEDFDSLYYLNCSNNKITRLNVTTLVNLTYLYCHYNKITSLNVSKNKALYELICEDNQLSNLDVSNNPILYNLRISNNLLTNIDLSKNQTLNKLFCNKNQLTSLDVSKNIKLFNLICNNNPYLKVICVTSISSANYYSNNNLYFKDSNAVWSEACKTHSDYTSNPKILTTNTLAIDSTINYSIGRNTASTCTTTAKDTNTIDAFYTFIAESNSASVELTLGNVAWLSAIELIDTLSYTSVANSCQNSLTGSLRTYNFTDLNIGQKYMIRLELGDVNPLGFARMSTVNNTFSVKIINTITGLEAENTKANKTISNIYNLQGLEVNKDYSGMVIYKYTDGSTKKVIQ